MDYRPNGVYPALLELRTRSLAFRARTLERISDPHPAVPVLPIKILYSWCGHIG